MTVADVLARIDEVRAVRGDPEVAHGQQDQLLVDVLTAIATGDHAPGDAVALASEALTVLDIKFPRWCA